MNNKTLDKIIDSLPLTDNYLKQSAICPVSKLRVLKKNAPSCKYHGKTYYFCYKKYLKVFKKFPEKYIKNLN